VIPRDEVVAFIVEQRDALFAALEGQE